MMRTLHFCVVAAALAGGGACTFDAGHPFASLRPSLDARLDEPVDRLLGDGWLKLSSDYQVRFTLAEMEIVRIDLVPMASSEMLSFDIANPPPGYSNCHNGHCHHVSGRLVPYDEIEAELAGGGKGPPAAAASLPLGSLRFIPGEARALTCEPSCDLPLGRVGRLRGPLARVNFEGEVRDGRDPPRIPGALRWRVMATLADAAGVVPDLAGTTDIPADRRHDPLVDLKVQIRPGPALFDGVDWAAVEGAGGVFDLGPAANAAAWEKVRVALLEIQLLTEVTRAPL